jgi:hypothetical protein
MERVLADAVRRCDAGEAPGCPLIETLSKAEGIGRLIPSSNRGRDLPWPAPAPNKPDHRVEEG